MTKKKVLITCFANEDGDSIMHQQESVILNTLNENCYISVTAAPFCLSALFLECFLDTKPDLIFVYGDTENGDIFVNNKKYSIDFLAHVICEAKIGPWSLPAQVIVFNSWVQIPTLHKLDEHQIRAFGLGQRVTARVSNAIAEDFFTALSRAEITSLRDQAVRCFNLALANLPLRGQEVPATHNIPVLTV